MPRRNGFQRPLHPMQVGAWVVISMMIFLNYFAVRGSLPDAVQVKVTQVVFLCVYSPAQLLFLVLGAVMTAWDPTDSVVYRHRAAMANKYQTPSSEFPEHLYPMMCTACNTNVSNTAKHCSRCDRCVESFDHHCKWLNNCIGKCNYKWFWMLLSSLILCSTLQGGFTVAAILSISRGGQTGVLNVQAALVLLIINLILTVIVFLGVSQLLIFHVWLVWKGLTTYEFIKHRRERKNRTFPSPAPPLLIDPTVKVGEKLTQETQADITHKIDESALMVVSEHTAQVTTEYMMR